MTFETTVRPRYRDLDTMGHVNNAVYATYVEQARIDFFREEVGRKLEESRAVLASLSIEFERPVDSLDDVTVSLDVTDVGSSSVTFAYDLRAGGERVATAESVQVALDDDGRPTPLDDGLREAFERHRAE
ncbi:acyl-CoA thioesterase [Candidatus Halobonum tyrrellensis]|uniref:Thioesterase superfamily protein n=1 Tax=Candidatus Halobonum tyrrellensis G22 TaxID=1324957 RepID=V4GW29_9EURY|nr:thioesterase family protein [Candidatus Halobonum tyrrellensis]ESP89341.1 thioesterase superfamily protein [Candidatus Halobonum tyrrellensis G22]